MKKYILAITFGAVVVFAATIVTKITDYPSVTTPADGDYFVTATSTTNNKITFANLKAAVGSGGGTNVFGHGTINTLAKFTGTNAVGDSVALDRTNYVEVPALQATNGVDTGMRFTSEGVSGGAFPTSGGVSVTATKGSFAGGSFEGATNSYILVDQGAFAGGTLDFSSNSFINMTEGASGGGWLYSSTDSRIIGNEGSYVGGNLESAVNSTIDATGASLIGGYLYSATASVVGADFGGIAMGDLDSGTSNTVSATTGSYAGTYMDSALNGVFAVTDGSFGVGNMSSTIDSRFSVSDGSFGFVNMASGSASNAMAISTTGSFIGGMLETDERTEASNGSFAFGQDVVSDGPYSWTFGRHYTNSTPDSFAVGFNGVTYFSVATNAPATFYAAITLGGTTNQISDNGTTLTRNGVPISGSGGGSTNFQSVVVTNNILSPWTVLTYSGTNVTLNLTNQFHRIILTNSTTFFTTPSNFPTTNWAETVQVAIQQDATGGRAITLTNGSFIITGSGTSTNAVPNLNTNASSLSLLTFTTSPFAAGKLLGISTTLGP